MTSQTPRATIVRIVAMLCMCLLLCLPALARGESLASVEGVALPALPADAHAAALVTLDERPLALGAERGWLLDAAGRAWTALELPGIQADALRDHARRGGSSWLLLDDTGQGLRIEALDWRAGAVRSRALPVPDGITGAARIAVLDGQLYLAGLAGDDTRLWSLPLDAAGASWREHDGWPGTAAPLALAAQKFALYLVTQDGRIRQWTPAEGWVDRGAVPTGLAPGLAWPIGQAHLLYGQAPAPGGGQAPLRLFHTITGAWSQLPGQLPDGSGVFTGWRNGVVAQGADGTLQSQQIHAGQHLLRWLDWTVISVYLAAMLGIGGYFYFKGQTGSESDFFVGGRSIPFWAAGISLYATNTSSISFIAIPAKAFDTNWQYMTNNLIAVLGLMFVAVWIVPLLRRLDLMSVFSYLETRFHPAIRMLSSALCIVMQIGSRMSVILFLPALAIATITGLDVVWAIMLMGVFTIIYSTVGGSKAVIWTDVVQVVVMFGGALFAIGFIFWSAGGDLPSLMAAAATEDKTRLFDFSFDLTKATVWGFIFLVVFDVVLTFPKDQVLMQRTLSTKDDKAAGRSIWTFAAIMIPGGIVFYGIGTALWMYYRDNPERLNPLLPIDATFPLFIAAELPAGVTGLIIAGIFAAAMSTLSSIINSVSTLVSVDFYQKLARNPDEKTALRIAEWSGVGVGLIGIAIALVMSRYDIHSLFDVSIELAGLLGGGFAGAYTLGMFTRRANSAGVAIGVAASVLITLVCWSMDLVHPYFYLAISIALCIVIGYVASLFFPAPTRSLEGLTIHTPAHPAR